MHNILVSNDITQDKLTIIDKVCVKMNGQIPCTFTNPSNLYRRTTDADNFTQASVSIVVERNNNVPDGWSNPLFQKKQTESDSITCTHATVPMNEAATQQLLDDNSNLRKENQQLKTTFNEFKTDMLQKVEVLERQSTNNEVSLINYKSQEAQDKRKLEKKIKQISNNQQNQSLVIDKKMKSL